MKRTVLLIKNRNYNEFINMLYRRDDWDERSIRSENLNININ